MATARHVCSDFFSRTGALIADERTRPCVKKKNLPPSLGGLEESRPPGGGWVKVGKFLDTKRWDKNETNDILLDPVQDASLSR